MNEHRRNRARRLKIEAVGDFWQRQIKPRIRLSGLWLEDLGFTPGEYVHVVCVSSGVLELRAQDGNGGDLAVAATELNEVVVHPQRVMMIRRAWRGSSYCLFSPALWMSDEELEQIAARVKGRTAPEIAAAVRWAETASDLLEACQATCAWSQSTGEARSEFTFNVLPKLERAIRKAEGGRP